MSRRAFCIVCRAAALAMAAACLATGVAAESDGLSDGDDMIWLASGERLRGKLEAFQPGEGVVWRHPDIQEPLPFDSSQILRIRLGQRPSTIPRYSFPCRVRLANQDELEGELAGLDASHLILETWYAGTLRIPRAMAARLIPVVLNPRIVFEGPTSLDGWTMGNAVAAGVESNAWTYSQGALVATASGSIARDVKLPDIASIDFDLSWSTYLHLAIALYADSLQPINLSLKDEAPDFGGFYSLQLNANIVNILTVKKGVPLNSLGIGIVPGLEGKTTAHVTIRTHKPERAVYLYLDGTLVKQWRDTADTLGKGTCLRFVNQGPNPLRLSNLVVSEWDGRLENPNPIVQNITNDVVRLLNRDVVAGTLTAFNQGNFKIAAAYGVLDIPIGRIEEIQLATGPRGPVPTSPGEMRANFHKRGYLTLKLEGWEDNKFVATHAILGRLKIKPAAFRLLDWKPVTVQ